MNMPNYKNYSLDELYDSLNHIDKYSYPDRIEVIKSEIQNRKENPKPKPENNFQKPKHNPLSEDKSWFTFPSNIGYFESYNITDLNSAQKAINQGWVTGLILGGYIFLMTLLALNDIKFILNENFNIYSIIDSTIVFVLSFGIYKRNQFFALALVLYIVLPELYFWITESRNSMSLLYFPLAFFTFKSFLGALKYKSFSVN